MEDIFDELWGCFVCVFEFLGGEDLVCGGVLDLSKGSDLGHV